MGLPTTAQRTDLLEEKATNIEHTMADMVSKAVERAMEAMRHSLTELIIESQSTAAKKMGVEFDAMSGILEGRLNRDREYQGIVY